MNYTEYIGKLLGYEVKVRRLPAKYTAMMPVALQGIYDFQIGEILEHAVCFALVSDPYSVTPAILKKQGDIIKESVGMPVVFVLKEAASYNVLRMINARINFTIPGKQLFVPELLLSLGKKAEKHDTKSLPIPATSQLLILYQLEVGNLDGKSCSDIAGLLAISYSNVDRALAWLRDNGIIKLEGAKEKKLSFVSHCKELWEAALPMLKSPVQKIIKTDSIVYGMTAGENALSEYGMLVERPYRITAIYRLQCPGEEKKSEYGENSLELWNYDPAVLAKDGTVDRLSLYLSMRDSDDERIKVELKRMLEGFQW